VAAFSPDIDPPPAAHRWGTIPARKAFAYAVYGGAAPFLLLFTSIHDPNLAMRVMALASFVVELSAPITWTTAMDLGGGSVGLLTGMMNTMGHVGGSIAPTIVGYLLAASGNNWNMAFYASAALYALGGLCWAALDPGHAA
jgi:ACS family glucarate transporter-like MFS transporter